MLIELLGEGEGRLAFRALEFPVCACPQQGLDHRHVAPAARQHQARRAAAAPNVDLCAVRQQHLDDG